jgi:hypothetical protein
MKNYFITTLMICVTFCLSACEGINFSPEAAAAQIITFSPDPSVTIDKNSFKPLQTVKVNDSSAIVVFTFQQNRNPSGQETCFYSAIVNKNGLSWQSNSDGGGCDPILPADQMEALRVDSGQSSSTPTDPGLSEVHGLVQKASVVKILLTWNDGLVVDVPIANGAFVTYRQGTFDMQSIQGLDAQGLVVQQIPMP